MHVMYFLVHNSHRRQPSRKSLKSLDRSYEIITIWNLWNARFGHMENKEPLKNLEVGFIELDTSGRPFLIDNLFSLLSKIVFEINITLQCDSW